MARVHSQQIFRPKYALERHQPYIGAFSVEPSKPIEYYKHITTFLLDEKISPENSDDVSVFFNLMFDSTFGAVNLAYYKYLLKKINNTDSTLSWRLLGRYVSFIGKRSTIYQSDLFDTLFRDFDNPDLWESFLKSLTPTDLRFFLENASKYSFVVEMLPKIKLYLLFS